MEGAGQGSWIEPEKLNLRTYQKALMSRIEMSEWKHFPKSPSNGEATCSNGVDIAEQGLRSRRFNPIGTRINEKAEREELDLDQFFDEQVGDWGMFGEYQWRKIEEMGSIGSSPGMPVIEQNEVILGMK
ncbi:hypothetical protein B7494_g714 [Chlorociboria aeruginascens]|nr:hypothetical protein B7494_g714 [Chlorociboria aeruginascens]